MKQTFFTLIIALMSAFVSTPVFASANGNTTDIKLEILSLLQDITIKQTITFKDNSQVKLYYQKKGNICKVYSASNLNKYSSDDLKRVKSTVFEVTDYVEGKCYITKTTDNVIKIAKNIFNELK